MTFILFIFFVCSNKKYDTIYGVKYIHIITNKKSFTNKSDDIIGKGLKGTPPTFMRENKNLYNYIQ